MNRCKHGEDTRSGSVLDRVLDTLDASEGDGDTLANYRNTMNAIISACQERINVASFRTSEDAWREAVAAGETRRGYEEWSTMLLGRTA